MKPLIPLIVLAVIIMIGMFAAFSVRSAQRVKQLKAQTLARAIPAEAIVQDVEPMGATAGGSQRVLVTLRLDVRPPAGGSYQATTRWFVDQIAIAQIQMGQTIRVRINADYRDRIYPDVHWADFADWQVSRE